MHSFGGQEAFPTANLSTLPKAHLRLFLSQNVSFCLCHSLELYVMTLLSPPSFTLPSFPPPHSLSHTHASSSFRPLLVFSSYLLPSFMPSQCFFFISPSLFALSASISPPPSTLVLPSSVPPPYPFHQIIRLSFNILIYLPTFFIFRSPSPTLSLAPTLVPSLSLAPSPARPVASTPPSLLLSASPRVLIVYTRSLGRQKSIFRVLKNTSRYQAWQGCGPGHA